MPYIYKITNKINNRSYIGQTNNSIQERWKEHCHDCWKERNNNRPLYMAMRKYGVEHFVIEVIEECSEEALSIREIFWIDRYDTFRCGYNATFGGSGKPMVDYGSVFETYMMLGENCSKTASLLGICPDTVSKIVKALGGCTRKDHGCKRINMFSQSGEYLRTFPSSREASRFLISLNNLDAENEGGYASHITSVCKGKRKTCQGYLWKYAS